MIYYNYLPSNVVYPLIDYSKYFNLKNKFYPNSIYLDTPFSNGYFSHEYYKHILSNRENEQFNYFNTSNETILQEIPRSPEYKRINSSDDLSIYDETILLKKTKFDYLMKHERSIEEKPMERQTSVIVINSSQKSNVQIKCQWKNCNMAFNEATTLGQHIAQMHSAAKDNERLYYCEWENCLRKGKPFNAKYKMLVHVKIHTNERPHHCNQCSKSFSRAENLKIHLRSHSGEKPYVCPVAGCTKAYSNSSDRFKHTRTHENDKPYCCKHPGCTKRYTDPSSLRKHVKSQHLKKELSQNIGFVNKRRTLSGGSQESSDQYFRVPELYSETYLYKPRTLSSSSQDSSIELENNSYDSSICNCKHTCNLVDNFESSSSNDEYLDSNLVMMQVESPLDLRVIRQSNF